MQPLYRAERPRGRLLPTHRRFSIDVRLDRVDRYQSYPSSQRKCEVCKNNRRRRKKCDCRLHKHCFEEWHGINEVVIRISFSWSLAAFLSVRMVSIRHKLLA